LLVHFPAMQSGATSNYLHLFGDDASLQRFLWWIMSAICLFFLSDWNQVLLLVDFPAIREQQQAITSISLRMMLLCFFRGYFLCIFCQQSVCSFSKTGITFVFFAALPTLHHKSVKLQEINLLHIKLGVRYRRDMEIETGLQTIFFFVLIFMFSNNTESTEEISK
jgi:hypothetical protein